MKTPNKIMEWMSSDNRSKQQQRLDHGQGNNESQQQRQQQQQRRISLPSLVVDLCCQLQGGDLKKLILGEPQSALYEEFNITSNYKKQVKQFLQLLSSNETIVTIVLGPRIAKSLLYQILEAIAQIPTLQSLSIRAQCWIPHALLHNIFVAKNHLYELNMENIRIEKNSWGRRDKKLYDKQYKKINGKKKYEYNFLLYPNLEFPQEEDLTCVLTPFLSKHLTRHKILRVHNCGWKHEQINSFYKYMTTFCVLLQEFSILSIHPSAFHQSMLEDSESSLEASFSDLLLVQE